MTLHFGTDQDLLCDSCRGHYWTGGVAQVVVHLPSKPEFKHQYWKKKKSMLCYICCFEKRVCRWGRGVLRFKLRAYTLSHSTHHFLWWVFIEIESQELFPQAGFKPPSAWSLPPDRIQAWATCAHLENIMLSEVSQVQKVKSPVFSLICQYTPDTNVAILWKEDASRGGHTGAREYNKGSYCEYGWCTLYTRMNTEFLSWLKQP
jgi:hypothetical protein